MKEYLKISLLPKDTNMYGTIFGGVIMSHLDLAAAHCARDVYENYFVTAFIHEMSFLHPVYVGDLVTFRGEVIDSGTTSVTVHVLVDAERLGTRAVNRVTEAKLVFVAVDRNGQKTPLIPRAGTPA
ncbi:MAG: hotdog domain-containing protein [bacterium]